MIQLTKEEMDSLFGFFEAEPNQVLKNGDVGYYQDADGLTIVQCCISCGEYVRVTIEPLKLLSFCASSGTINEN